MVDTQRCALITGGAGTLAQATAEALRRRGWQVLTPSRQELDVTQAKAVEAYCSTLERLDYLICMAGVLADAPLVRVSQEAWDLAWETNFLGAKRCVLACWKKLGKSQGSIALIGSHAGAQGRAGQVAYGAAKAALAGLNQSLASQGTKENIRVNLVLPGFLETKMTANLADKHRDTLRLQHLLGQFNTPENAAVFLAQLPELKHTSGQSFALDSRPLP